MLAKSSVSVPWRKGGVSGWKVKRLLVLDGKRSYAIRSVAIHDCPNRFQISRRSPSGYDDVCYAATPNPGRFVRDPSIGLGAPTHAKRSGKSDWQRRLEPINLIGSGRFFSIVGDRLLGPANDRFGPGLFLVEANQAAQQAASGRGRKRFGSPQAFL